MTVDSQIYSAPMIFLRIGWMEHYQGLQGDSISLGGGFVTEKGYGLEMFNFLSFEGSVYGYVRPPSKSESWDKATLNLDRLAGVKTGEKLEGVLVVWVATSPQGHGRVVGWYQNATVHRHIQPAPSDPRRQHSTDQFMYYVSASEKDATCLELDARVIEVPYRSVGFGQANIMYPDNPEKHQQLKEKVWELVIRRSTKSVPRARQVDAHRRQLIEQAAVGLCRTYYEELGYQIVSKEKENLGWDLEASFESLFWRIEVKGLSGLQQLVELTANEYSALNEHRDNYRLCVVTQALDDPQIDIFLYSQANSRWESEFDASRVLEIEKRIVARCRT